MPGSGAPSQRPHSALIAGLAPPNVAGRVTELSLASRVSPEPSPDPESGGPDPAPPVAPARSAAPGGVGAGPRATARRSSRRRTEGGRDRASADPSALPRFDRGRTRARGRGEHQGVRGPRGRSRAPRRRSGTAAGRRSRPARCRGGSRLHALRRSESCADDRSRLAASCPARRGSSPGPQRHASRREPSNREYSPLMAPRLLLGLVIAFLVAAPAARADLVQLEWAHLQHGARLARQAGGVEVARELRLWSVPSRAVPALRRAGVVHLARPDRLLATESVQAVPTDPLVPMEWWRAAVGADRVDPPGAGKPVTVVDSGIDLTHPEFANRPNTTALNPPALDLAAPGAHNPVAEPLDQGPSGYLLDASGTSFASPLVAGAAAWVWTARPTLDNTQLFELMRRSATDIGAHGFDNATGWGLLNIPAALAFPAPRRDPQEPNDRP